MVQGQWSDVQVYNDSVSLMEDTLQCPPSATRCHSLYTCTLMSTDHSAVAAVSCMYDGCQRLAGSRSWLRLNASKTQVLWLSSDQLGRHQYTHILRLCRLLYHCLLQLVIIMRKLSVIRLLLTICTISSTTRIFLIANHQPPF